MKLHELREARARAVTEMRSLTDTAEVETRDLTEQEDARFKTLRDEISALDRKIERAETLAEAERSAPAILVTGRLGDGAFETRARDFSVSKVIRNQLGERSDCGFENEMSQEVARRSGGRTFQGIAVPDQIFDVPAEARTLTVGSAAADLVPNVHRPDLFVNKLRSALVTGRLGATVLDNLQGTIDIPRQTGSSQAQWVDEEGSLTETDGSFDDVTLSPKTVGAMTSYSRRTLLNASPAIEQIVRNDLASIVANAIDLKAMTGDGSSNTPTGITNSGVSEISMSSPTWAKILEFIATIEHADVTGGYGWAMNAHGVKKFRGTLKVSDDAGAGFLMDNPGSLGGYSVATTSALPGAPSDGSPLVAHPATVLFGNWNDLLIGYWSGLDLLVNPYESTAYAKGRVLLRAMRDVDVKVRRTESFAFADDLPVT